MKSAPLFIVIAALTTGCPDKGRPPPAAPVSGAVSTTTVTTGRLDFGEVGGLSGLTRGADPSTFFAIPERDPVVFVIREASSELSITGTLTVAGVPPGLDTEAITRIDDDTFAMGTESTAERDGDLVLLARRRGDRIEVQHKLHLPYAIFGFTPEENRGIEGVCAAGGLLLAAVETPIEHGKKRYVPLARTATGSATWTAFKVPLSSDSGKAAGMDCRVRGGQLEVFLIERHYEVSRVLRFTVPMTGPGRILTATVARDLDPAFTKNPNFEGLALTEGGVFLLSDNQGGRIYTETFTALFSR